MNSAQILANFQALQGKGIRYVLGADDLTPPDLALDCSAAYWRACNSRKFDGKRWRNTDWIVNDALGKRTLFDRLTLDEVRPGDALVYGRATNNGKVGHICVVVDVAKQLVIECASSAGGIIQQRRPAFFRKVANGTAIFVRYKGAPA